MCTSHGDLNAYGVRPLRADPPPQPDRAQETRTLGRREEYLDQVSREPGADVLNQPVTLHDGRDTAVVA